MSRGAAEVDTGGRKGPWVACGGGAQSACVGGAWSVCGWVGGAAGVDAGSHAVLFVR